MKDNNAAVAVSLGGSRHKDSGNEDPSGGLCSPTCTILTPSAAMHGVSDRVTRIADTNSAVLIRGEPGAGKETVAREIHRNSGRASRAFVRVACGAIREEQLNAQLFGRDGNRLLDDKVPSPSLLAHADNGTLFLKDVSDLPFWAQVKLLDALQQGDYGQFEGIGTAPLDVRVIATTTCDLESAVAQGRFHAGLYYHLNIVEIRIPPLRERREDIRPLAEFFLARINHVQTSQEGGTQYHLSEEAWQWFLKYDWPGNARELASVIAHAVVMADGNEIGLDNGAEMLRKARPRRDCETISVQLVGGLKEIERSVIEAVIERCRGNKAAAARVLGLHRRTLYRILQEEGQVNGQPKSPATSFGAQI